MQTLTGKGRHLAVLAISVLLVKALWFSASAVIPQLAGAWQLDGSQRAWLTMSVQLGFVAGALARARSRPNRQRGAVERETVNAGSPL